MRRKNFLVFIVEDDVPCGKLLEYYLRKNGYTHVVLFTEENTFLNELKQHPHIVITDFRLKSMNGIELMKYAREIHSGFYCILFSGMNYDEIFNDETPETYVDKYIRKGLTGMEELLQELDAWTHRQYVEQLY